MATDANYCVVDIATTRYTDVRSAEVRAATADNNSSSFFKAVFDNQNGIYNNTFTLNDEVIIHSTDISNPYDDLGGSSWENKIFLGVIEDINSTEDSKGRARLILSGRDYSAILQDITVEPTIYNDTEISEIVTNLMATYAPQITITNVNVTAVTLTNLNKSKNFV